MNSLSEISDRSAPEANRRDVVEVLLRALDNGRLPHGIMLHGVSLETLERACFRIAARLLETSPERVGAHPDLHALRPANKMRRIGIEDMRVLINERILKTPAVAERKVAVIYDAERMQKETADTFLKTLEEPPADCTIFLLTTKPTHLSDTVRSRCLHFRVAPDFAETPDAAWGEWLRLLEDGIKGLVAPFTPARVADAIFAFYGLAARFDSDLKTASAAEWKRLKETLPEGISEEQELALETGVFKNIRQRRFAEIAECLRRMHAANPSAAGTRALHESLSELEKAAGLLEVNFGDAAAIEYVLLRLLRAWSRR